VGRAEARAGTGLLGAIVARLGSQTEDCMATTNPAPLTYDAEMRFGVVMYGGVSLAIYIYGAAYELHELANATPLDGAMRPSGDEPGGDTRDIYRRLALLAGNDALRSQYAQAIRLAPGRDAWRDDFAAAGDATRFAVDVIAGTSAGGINGIFLAKALTHGQRFGALGGLWVNDGDIGALINDRQAYRDLPAHVTAPDEPASLLASDRMFVKLREAFDAMAHGIGDAAESRLVEELDLFVTTTDIEGTPVPLRLFDKVVYERRHKQRLHFSYPSLVGGANDRGHDFAQEHHPFLAFAARCTSSFPFAFEPMTIERLRRLCPGIDDARLAEWREHFAEGPKPEDGRTFGDGGYLDNKPFSHVVDALSRRFGDAPVQRKLLYVEPDPERLGAEAVAAPVPDAVANAAKALLVIPQYETIREDLRLILQRNRRIERVERIVQLSEQEAEARASGFERVECRDGKVPAWASLTLADMVRYYGEGFAPYRRLRIYAVTDWLAEQLAGAFGVDTGSDQAYALRAVVRAWREGQYADDPPPGSPLATTNAFLGSHDFDYRLRRRAFVLRRIDAVTRLVRGLPAGPVELERLLRAKVARHFGALDPLSARRDLVPLLLDELQSIKRTLRKGWRELLDIRRRWRRGEAVRTAIQPDAALRGELDAVLTMLLGMPPEGRVRTVRDVNDTPVEIPADLHWPHGAGMQANLQDAVYKRVEDWLGRSAGKPMLKLWQALGQAMQATRVDAGSGPALVVDRWLDEAWKLLGSPELVAREQPAGVDAQGQALRRHVAELQVRTPDRRADGRPFANAEEKEAGRCLRALLGEYYLSFDWYDQTRFTLYYDTGTGEPSTVDVIRVSPMDATSLRESAPERPTLAGVAVAHFGAFLDAHWRRNDIMWGRLDGAERLVATVLPEDDGDTATVRKELLRLVHGRILEQTLRREHAAELTRRLVRALAATPGAWGRDRLARLLDALKLPSGRARDALADSLAALLQPDALIEYAKSQPTFDPEPAAAPTLDSAARAVAVTGKILQAVSRSRAPQVEPLARWTARLGLLLQGAMSVVVPGTLRQRLAVRLMPQIYFVEVFLLLLGFTIGGADLRATALTAFVATLTLHMLVLLLRDRVTEGRWGFAVTAVVLALLLGFPTAVGVIALSRDGPVKAACGPAPASAASGAMAKACAWLR
jgi:patatin-related protein